MILARRNFVALLPAIAAAQQRQEAGVLPSKAYPFEQLKGQPGAALKSYPILIGATQSGYRLDLHESELAPGTSPHAPHKHGANEDCATPANRGAHIPPPDSGSGW